MHKIWICVYINAYLGHGLRPWPKVMAWGHGLRPWPEAQHMLIRVRGIYIYIYIYIYILIYVYNYTHMHKHAYVCILMHILCITMRLCTFMHTYMCKYAHFIHKIYIHIYILCISIHKYLYLCIKDAYVCILVHI